jgi:hypothetical protein
MARFQQATGWHNPVLFLKHILAALFLFPAHREAGTKPEAVRSLGCSGFYQNTIADHY